MILWMEALFAVRRCSRPHSQGQGVAAVALPQVQEGDQENLGERDARRERNDAFGVQ